MATVRLVGFDCATDPRHVGLALGELASGVRLLEVRKASSRGDIVDTIVGWLRKSGQAVFAIDAPLGWPAPLGAALAGHQAGAPVVPDAHSLFRRRTDVAIKQRLGKQPLDVGADRIARTAHAALEVLNAVRERVPVTLGWQPGNVEAKQAIEAYPAATLTALGLRSTGYKTREAKSVRRELLASLPIESVPDEVVRAATDSDDVLDAVLCVLGAGDFATGNAVAPDDLELAKREGWIWTRHAVT